MHDPRHSLLIRTHSALLAKIGFSLLKILLNLSLSLLRSPSLIFWSLEIIIGEEKMKL